MAFAPITPRPQPAATPTNPETAYWKNWDWAKAIEGGQESVGREFSGEYGFVQTVMYWPITHMVSPADQALSCKDCHNPHAQRQTTERHHVEADVEQVAQRKRRQHRDRNRQAHRHRIAGIAQEEEQYQDHE